MTGEQRIRNTTIKVRLYPTPAQAELFEKTFGCCRWLWNQMLADQEKFYAETDVHFLPTPAKYKKGAPFLKEVDSGALATVHQNLRKAFQHFFDSPQAYRHPTYKRKKSGRASYTIYCQRYSAGKGANIYLTKSGVRLPKAGEVKAKLHRRPLHWWTLKTATVSRTLTGKYFCSLTFSYPVKVLPPVLPTAETTLGLNYSLAHFYVDSQGKRADPARWLAASRNKLAKIQRRMARMQPGSRNYRHQLRKLRRLHEHLANQRKDFLHQESRRLANTWDAICVRQPDLLALSQSLHQGSINVMDAGYSRFLLFLAYKLECQGKSLLTVKKTFPSAKLCHQCGAVYDDLPAEARQWICPSCGAHLDRARNGAENLRDQGLAQFYDNHSTGAA